jgi:hypothetical protein
MANCNDTTTASGKPTEVSNVIKADVNFTVLKGDTFDAILKFLDGQCKPLSFTGATLLMHIRDSNDALLVTLQSGSGFSVSSNIVTFNYIPNPPIFTVDTYFYDLQCTFANGLVKTLIGGKFKVQKEITIP